MTYQIFAIEPVFPIYRVEGDGPIGFAVMSRHKLLGGHQSKDAAAKKAGEIARETLWVNLVDICRSARLDWVTALKRLGELGRMGESTDDLFLICVDLDETAIGGHLLIGDLWHHGHVRDSLPRSHRNSYLPLKWTLHFLKETERRAALVDRE